MGIDLSAIIVAVLALVGTLVGSYCSNSRTTALISYRLEQLEERVQAHNHLVERMTVVERDLKSAFHAIHDISETQRGKEQ